MTEVVQGEQPSSLDEAQEFAAASSYQVRDELAGLIERDLLGPWDGELPDLLTMQNAGRMWASSMGLSCVVASGVGTLTVTAVPAEADRHRSRRARAGRVLPDR